MTKEENANESAVLCRFLKVKSISFKHLIFTGEGGGGKGGRVPPRDFPSGNFWQLIGKNEARKKWNVEENEAKGKGKRKIGKDEKGKEKNEKCKGKKDFKKAEETFFFAFFAFHF